MLLPESNLVVIKKPLYTEKLRFTVLAQFVG